MELIGAALGDDSDLTAGVPALIGAEAGDSRAEFLDGIERNRDNRVEAVGSRVVVNINAIELDVVLIGPCASDLTGGCNAGLDTE